MGTDSVIYIRTDGNAKIATGHLVRCLCIAQALEKLGRKVCFLISDTTSYELLKDLCNTVFYGVVFSFEVKILESAVYNNLDLEIDELSDFLSKSTNFFEKNSLSCATSESSTGSKPNILIDSYYVSETYFTALNQVAKVAYMDDLRAFDYDVDLVINYDVIPSSRTEEYRLAYTKAKTTLLGAEYTPLREQFQNQSIALKETIQNVLITSGGSDPYHFTEAISSFLIAQNFDFNMHIVVGRLFDNVAALETLSRDYPQIHLYQNVKDMASLMKQCDYAISAAGTTLYELCALGIPTISFTMADNQIIMAKTFAETGAVPYAGDIRSNPSSVLNIVKEHLTSSMQNADNYNHQHLLMRQVTNGNGTILIAQKLCEL